MRDNKKEYVQLSMQDLANLALGLEKFPETNGSKLDIDDLLKKGWKYENLNWMLESYWQYIMAGLGEEDKDYHTLIKTHDRERNMWRGQILTSPKGRANLAQYSKDHPIPFNIKDNVQ